MRVGRPGERPQCNVDSRMPSYGTDNGESPAWFRSPWRNRPAIPGAVIHRVWLDGWVQGAITPLFNGPTREKRQNREDGLESDGISSAGKAKEEDESQDRSVHRIPSASHPKLRSGSAASAKSATCFTRRGRPSASSERSRWTTKDLSFSASAADPAGTSSNPRGNR